MIQSERNFKIVLILLMVSLASASILIWFQTPDLFEYFNQAFCTH